MTKDIYPIIVDGEIVQIRALNLMDALMIARRMDKKKKGINEKISKV